MTAILAQWKERSTLEWTVKGSNLGLALQDI